MVALKVEIDRWVDDTFPGWVECRFVDCAGREHVFVEKAPVVSNEALDAHSAYPRPGLIGCIIVGERVAPDGAPVLVIETATPWGIESSAGGHRFEMLPSLVVDSDASNTER